MSLLLVVFVAYSAYLSESVPDITPAFLPLAMPVISQSAKDSFNNYSTSTRTNLWKAKCTNAFFVFLYQDFTDSADMIVANRILLSGNTK